MSFGNQTETDILALYFEATAIANIADNAGSSPLTNLYVSLHTGSPADTGDQTTNECAYTSYARVAVARSGSGWTTTSGQVVNDAAVTFPQATGGSETATHFGIGTGSSGTGKLIVWGALNGSLAISSGITPEFGAGDLSVTLD